MGRILSTNARIIPTFGETDTAGQDPTTPEEQEGLAQLALLSGVPENNRQVAGFIAQISNTTLTASVQGASR